MDETPGDTLVLSTLACALHDGCLVYVGGRAMSPADADWDEYMRFIDRRKVRGQEMRALVLERGFGPTMRQRQMLHAATADHRVRVAVLTNSTFARGVTVMVALVRPGYKAFPLDKLDDAFTHVGIEVGRRRQFEELLRALEAKLERMRGQPPASSLY